MVFTESPRAFLAQFGKVAVRGASTEKVIFDNAGRETLDGHVIDADPSITLPSSVWPDLARGDALTVDGSSYIVRDFMPIDDGAWKTVSLRAA